MRTLATAMVVPGSAACVAAANGAEWHPGAAPRDAFDQRGRPCTSAESWDHCRAGYEEAVAQTRALFFELEPEEELVEPRRRLAAARPAPPVEGIGQVRDVSRGTGAVRDVVIFQYEGSQVPLVVREDQSLGAAAATWCRAERPKDRGCVRALGVLAATSKLR